MKKENMKASFQAIKPDEQAKERMLTHIKQADIRANATIKFKRFVPVVMIVLLIGIGVILSYPSMLQENQTADWIAEDGQTEMWERESVHELQDEFQLGNRHYHLLEPDVSQAFGLPNGIDENDIGAKLATITTSIDENLIGKEVYHYVPAASEAVVAVKIAADYRLYHFYNFASYLDNEDEAVQAYFDVYDINDSSDIDKIQLITYPHKMTDNKKTEIMHEIKDTENITRFYNYYAVLEEESEQYFDRLSKGSEGEVDNPDGSIMDEGTEGQSTPAYEGTSGDMLANAVNIRIYHQSGVYYETIYYPNIGFISRHQITDDFASFLKDYIR